MTMTIAMPNSLPASPSALAWTLAGVARAHEGPLLVVTRDNHAAHQLEHDLRTLIDDAIPMNDGCLRPVTLIVPEGSMLRPRYPAAVVAGRLRGESMEEDMRKPTTDKADDKSTRWINL